MKERRARWGDRREGRLLRNLHPLEAVAPFLMANRNGATNLFRDRVEIRAAERYARAKRDEGLAGFSLLHVLLAAYVRTVSQRPGINRFVSGQRIYARSSIVVNMVARKEMTLEGESAVVKAEFSPTDAAADVYRRFSQACEAALAEEGNGTEAAAFAIARAPRLVKKFAIWLVRVLDYFGLLPASLIRISPFHASMFITSMGSLGVPPVFHHLYDVGNVPVFVSFGAKYAEVELDRDGAPTRRRYVDFTVSADERICDGFYFASALRMFLGYLKDPTVLDRAPEAVVRDID